jgi:hypothetical protein
MKMKTCQRFRRWKDNCDMQFRLVTGGDLRMDQVESYIQRDIVQMVEFTHNVFHQRAGQPTELVKKAWHNQLKLRIFNFIAIK